jgi:hypothetical protein
MNHLFDEFSKSLSQSSPRRESLRRLGAVFAGAVLSPLGLETAWAQNPDPCKAFCKCRPGTQQNQCLAACKACNGNTGRLAGSCGSYTCCSIASCKGVCSNLKSNPNCGACGNDCRTYGETCCGSYCADLQNDIFNCGRCGTVCPAPDANETVACISGLCAYDCVPGAVDCGDGTCTDLTSNPDNCGACGNVCPQSAPVCFAGACTTGCQGYCPEGWCGGDGCGGECACPSGMYCESNGWCYPGCSPDSPYYPNC